MLMLLLILAIMSAVVFALLALPIFSAQGVLRRDKWLSVLVISVFTVILPLIAYFFGGL